mgnify:CR=1 FL=1
MRTIALFALFAAVTAAVYAKPAPAPAWVTDTRGAFPDAEYLAQRGSGTSAEKARTDAAAALARYFQMNVNAQLSTTLTAVSDGSRATEQTVVVDAVQVQSQVQLFGIAFTDAYRSKADKTWYCVAYLRREAAWTPFHPKLALSKPTFEGLLALAQNEQDSFTRLGLYKSAWEQGKSLAQTLAYGRILSPQKKAAYQSQRDAISQIPVAFEREKAQCTVFIRIAHDQNGIFAAALASALTNSGFSVATQQAQARYTATLTVDDNQTGDDPLSIQPAAALHIASSAQKPIFSHTVTAAEKSIAYTAENARKKAYPKLAQELEDSIKQALSAAFSL